MIRQWRDDYEPSDPCDNCGHPGAIHRVPGTGVYLCASCQRQELREDGDSTLDDEVEDTLMGGGNEN